MSELNVDELAALIKNLLKMNGNGDLTSKQRIKALVTAKRLRGLWLNLVTAEFEEGAAAISNANSELAKVNKQAKAALDDVEKVAKSLEAAAKLVGILDKLLGIAVKFA